MSWITEPVGRSAGVGVVIVPPLGYEYWSFAPHLANPGRTLGRARLSRTAIRLRRDGGLVRRPVGPGAARDLAG